MDHFSDAIKHYPIFGNGLFCPKQKFEYVEELFYLKEQYFTTQRFECKIFFSPNNYLIVIIMRVYHCCFSVQTTNISPRAQS